MGRRKEEEKNGGKCSQKRKKELKGKGKNRVPPIMKWICPSGYCCITTNPPVGRLMA